MKFLSVLSALLVACILVNAQQQKEPTVYFDNEKWTEYVQGDIPLVISVPHGGRITADSLAVRSCKGAVVGTDGGTIQMARAIAEYYYENYGVRPHLIINHLQRKHLDQNRELPMASCGNAQVESAWYQFRKYIDTAITQSLASYKKVLYIDLHGHDHKVQRLEVGHLLNGAELRDAVEGKFPTEQKAYSNLLKANKSLSAEDILFGEKAFGTILTKNGLPAVPSAQDKAPVAGDPFFRGGDNTVRYTSENYPKVIGLQIEANKDARSVQNREKSGEIIAKSTYEYLQAVGKIKIKKVR